MLGILISIGVAMLKALSELAGKFSIQTVSVKNLDEYSLALGIRVFTILPLLCVYIYQSQYHFESSYIPLILLWSIWNAITTVTSLKAVKYGDLSLVGPLSSLTIPFLLLTGYVINNELPNIYGFIWVFCIFFWTYFLWFSDKKWSLLDPIKNIAKDTWARYMIVTSIIWSITAPIDKLWIQAMGIIPWLLYFNITISILIYLYIVVFKNTHSFKNLWSFSNVKKITLTWLLAGWASFLQLLAIKYTLVVYVVSIKRSSGLFSVLLWALYFKEKNIPIKLLASCIMIIGILCIALWGNI